MDRATAPEKKGSRHNPQHAVWPIHGSVLSLSPKIVTEAVGVKLPPVDCRLLGLSGPYDQHVIGTFNTCSLGPTYRSWTDTGGGYNHLRAPSDLQYNQGLPRVPMFELKEPRDAMWCSDHSAIYQCLHLRLTIANDLSLAIALTRIDQKEILMQLGYQSNSYNLMQNQES
jgi:hypothetical protein